MADVSERIYVRTSLKVPGVGTVIHAAELEEKDATTCRMHRIVELAGTAPNSPIAGAATGSGKVRGMDAAPNPTVPHPDTYANFPDIASQRLSAQDFERLWARACAAFPDLA